ncbi:PP2C family protein-serine/threonine phosphatase [Streptomyces echinatus]|uniref:PP2C family protein-serine/threonine phosphatase n=1 Tax=Streptomyces echinatus TaxID=67293 RepID=UPI0031EA353B
MLPRSFSPPGGIEIAHRYLPASDANEVGGDWYDVAAMTPGRAALAIGDVMGHGIPAAAVMGQMRSTLRALARLDLPPRPAAAPSRPDDAGPRRPDPGHVPVRRL